MGTTMIATMGPLMLVALMQPSYSPESAVRPDASKPRGDEQVKELGDVKAPADLKFGAVIVDVKKDSPALKGSLQKDGEPGVGLEKGDVITHIDGKEVKSAKDYYDLMKGDDQKELRVVDKSSGDRVTAYFKPEKGALGIKFYIVPQK